MVLKNLTYQRTIRAHKAFHNGSKEMEEKLLEIYLKEMLIKNEVVKHDFTKRQLRIVMFIAGFSFSFWKHEAIIPKIQDFELAGIPRNKIKGEIAKLEEMNVVEWDKEKNIFRIADITGWKVPNNDGYNEKRMSELFELNFKDSTFSS